MYFRLDSGKRTVNREAGVGDGKRYFVPVLR